MNWAVVESSVLAEARQLARRRIVPLEHSLYELMMHGVTANPRDASFGRATLYHLVLERLLRVCSADFKNPTKEEIQQAFDYVPELKQVYSLKQRGAAWTVQFRTTVRRWRAADWAAYDWSIVFDLGETTRFFALPGSEFKAISSLLPLLNGDRREDEIVGAFPEHRKTVRRFLKTCDEIGLLERSNESLVPSRKGSFVHRIGHACLRFQEDDTSILFDPLFFLPRPQTPDEKNSAVMVETMSQFSKLTAVFITHHHWDHLHFSTVVRLPRHIPIYVPRVTAPTPFNPNVADFFRSLGFAEVHEVDPWQTYEFDGIRITPTPYVGEWCGPNSEFDGFTYLVQTARKTLYGAVDADRDERGTMLPVLKELKSRVGHVDYVFFNASNVEHESPAFCGMPFNYSNLYAAKFSDMMRYLPNAETVFEWLDVLSPKAAVRYADFSFIPRARRGRSRSRLGSTPLEPLHPGQRLPL